MDSSWDRVPYITTLRSGQPSIVPADRHIHVRHASSLNFEIAVH